MKNKELDIMMTILTKLLPRRDKIGYVAARNYRAIQTVLTEYFVFKSDLIKKYGEKNEDDNTITVMPNTEKFNSFMKEFEPIANIEQEVSIMEIPFDDVIDILTGEEILNIDWMLSDKE